MKAAKQTPTALITGGGGAIAEATALRLDQMGYQMILSDRIAEPAQRVAAKLSRPAKIIVCDQTRPEDLENLLDTVRREHADLDVLINNAGYTVEGPFVGQHKDEIERVLDINLRSPLHLIRGILPLMLERNRGAIVSIVSMGGILALADSALYSAAKFGLRGFLTAIHEEVRDTKINISGVYPAAVDTPMLMHEALHGGSVLNWVGAVQTPDAVARAIVYGIRTGRMEIYVPYSDGFMTRVLGFWPWLQPKLAPVLKTYGDFFRRRWLKSKGYDPATGKQIAATAPGN